MATVPVFAALEAIKWRRRTLALIADLATHGYESPELSRIRQEMEIEAETAAPEPSETA